MHFLVNLSNNLYVDRQQASADRPPVKTLTRRGVITSEGGGNNPGSSSSSSSSSSSKQVMQMISNYNSLFVKVNMEGSKIGRKIDVSALHGYPHLLSTLEHMFSTPNILCKFLLLILFCVCKYYI